MSVCIKLSSAKQQLDSRQLPAHSMAASMLTARTRDTWGAGALSTYDSEKDERASIDARELRRDLAGKKHRNISLAPFLGPCVCTYLLSK